MKRRRHSCSEFRHHVMKRRMHSCSKRRRRRRRTGNETESDYWSSIPDDILYLISQKIGSVDNYVRFSAVCRSWHSFLSNSTNKPRPGVPLFVSGISEESETITLQNPASDRTLTLRLPETGVRFLWGTPFGWLIAFHPPTRFSLFNPFTGSSIALPNNPRPGLSPTARCYLTASPDSNPDNCLVIISRFDRLTFTRLGQYREYWHDFPFRGTCDVYGVTYFKGKLYGIRILYKTRQTQVVSLRLFNGHFCLDPVTFLLLPQRLSRLLCQEYLVDIDGQLCLCVRYYPGSPSVNFRFWVIDVSTGSLTPLLSSGDRCLFLDRSYSFSYKASYPPAKLFERHEHAADEFVSSYVFYNDKALGLQVWDMLHSCKVLLRSVPSSPTSSLWILPPLK